MTKQTKLPDEFYVALVKTTDGIFLLLRDKKNVQGWLNEYDAMRYWEDSYTKAHFRGFQTSMSACWSFIMMTPSVIKINGAEDVEKMAGENPSVFRIASVAGNMLGIKLKKNIGQKLWDSGRKPKLADPGMFV